MTEIMGILNVTPDSFSDGGLYLEPEKAVAHAREMIRQGADVIDIGAVSTRPGSAPVDGETELERLRPVLSLIKKEGDIPFTVDTYSPAAASLALECGCLAVNDVSGALSPEIARLAARYGAAWIVMHARGPAGADADYPDGVVADVAGFFERALEAALDCGLKKEQVILDPGFGFSKDVKQNVELFSRLGELKKAAGTRLLAGFSRKRFVGAICGSKDNGALDAATASLCALAAAQGADIVRVHNVALCRAALDASA